MNDTQTNNNSTATKVVNALRWIGAAILPLPVAIIIFFVAMFLGHFALLFGHLIMIGEEGRDTLLFFLANGSAGFSIPNVAHFVAPNCKRTACIVISTVYASLYGMHTITLLCQRNWNLAIMEIALAIGVIAGVISICQKN